MSSAGAIKAGEAYVEFSMRDAKLKTGLAGLQSMLKGIGEGMKTLGRGMALGGASILVPLGLATKEAADFQSQMNLVSSILDDPAMWMERYRTGVRDLSIQFGKSTQDMAAGMYDILGASIPAADALYVLAESGKAAVAGNTETAVATDALTTVLNAYGLAASEAGHVSDVLFQTVLRGKTLFPEIAASIGNVATTAATVGVPLEDMSAMLALLTRNGIGTEEAVTSLQAILSSFLSPSKESAEMARSLGFEMNSATLQAEGLEGVMKRLGDVPPDTLAALFPNIRALKGLLPAMQNMGGFADDLKAMREAAGSTDRAYEKMANGVNFSFSQMVQAGKAAAVAIGEPLLQGTTDALKVLAGLATGIRRVAAANPQLVVTALKVGAALAAAGVAIFVVGSGLVSLAGGIGAIAGIVAAFSAAWPVIVGGASSAGAALAAFATPAGVVLVVLVAIAASVWKLSGAWDGMKTSASAVFEVLRADGAAALGGIRDALLAGDIPAAARVMWALLDLEWTRGVVALKIAWVELWEAWQLATTNGAQVVYEAWQGLVAKLRGLWTGFIGWYQTAIETLSGTLAKVILFVESGGSTDGFAAVDDMTGQAQANLEKEIEARKDAIKKERDDAIATSRAQNAAEIDGIANASNAKIGALEDRVKAAQAELAAANKAAADARAALQQATATQGAQAKAAADGTAAGLRSATTASGDFSAAYLKRLTMGGAGDASERTAEATEAIETQQERTNRLLMEISAKIGMSFT